jgi:hypothetical protein
MLAAGAVILLVITSGLYLGYLHQNNGEATVGTTIYEPYPLALESVNATTGLELKLQLNTTLLLAGEGLAANITLFNTINSTNNVTTSSDWPITHLALGPCGTTNYPMGIAVFAGYFSQSNISSASKPLSLYMPGAYMCPLILSNISAYVFKPQSDTAQILGSCNTGSCFELNTTSQIDAGGSWGEARAFSSFSPGPYTVVGGDEWGQMLILHFAVTLQTNTYLATTT